MVMFTGVRVGRVLALKFGFPPFILPTQAMSEQLIDTIYEAAVLPERWADVLNGLSDRFGGKGGILFTSALDNVRWLGAGESEQTFADWVAQGWAAQNFRVPRALKMSHPGFITDLDLCSAEEIATSPMYNEFLIPRGYIACAGTTIQGATGDMLIFSVEGFESEAAARATFPVLDSLRPHLARAAMLSSQLHLERARAAVTALELVGAPAAFVTDQGGLMASNPRFDALLGREILDIRKSLRFPDAKVDELYRQALHRVRADKVGRSIPLPGGETSLRGILHVVPIRGSARDIFTSGGAILVIAGHAPSPGLSPELLQGLFDLTPAEARLARALMQGLTTAGAARQFGMAEATVRTQMKSLFAKTGQSRQSDLVRMLASFIALSSP